MPAVQVLRHRQLRSGRRGAGDRVGHPERTVTIPITATDQDGGEDLRNRDDYSGVPARVTFNAAFPCGTFQAIAIAIVVEGNTANITVTLNQDPERTVIIPVTAVRQGGATTWTTYSRPRTRRA